MTERRFRGTAFALAAVCVASAAMLAQERRAPSAPVRDTPIRQRQAAAEASGGISGRVLAADTGRPISRARVVLSAAELPEGRGVLTGNDGTFEFTDLPAGRYTVAAGKNGFVGLAYGQRRPLQAGTPLQLKTGERLTAVEVRLPRGSIVTGHVFDEAGEPAVGITVRVLRYRYAQGVRQLMPGGMAQTDDRGEYRIWGLNPGEYYVAAFAQDRLRPAGGPPRGGRGGFGAAWNDASNPGVVDASESRQDESGYAPTYYPGTESIDAARAVTVGLSAEASGIDFNLMLVRTSRVAGRVMGIDGSPVTAGTIALTPEGSFSRIGSGSTYGARITADGAFTIGNVPPGRYVLRARTGDGSSPRFASLPLTVAGTDVPGVNVIVAPGAAIVGAASFKRTKLVGADPSRFRIGAPSADGSSLGPSPTTPLQADGTFTLDGVSAGEHWIRAQVPAGWVLHSVTLGGRDITDTPIDLRSGQRLVDVRLVFTDNLAEISGAITDDRGTPIREYTVLAFPDDPTLWKPQARQIMTARPDQTGTFRLRGLPPGEYLLALIDPAEQGEWFEPAFLDAQVATSTRVQLAEGEVKTHNVRIAGR